MRPAVAEMFHADGQTDMTNPLVAFRIPPNGPNKTDCSEYRVNQSNSLLKERKWYVQHNYLLLCVVESNRLHVSTLHAGHL